MLRFVNACLLLGLAALAFVSYEVKYESRQLEGEITGVKKEIDAERDSIAVLRAEWSLLNRPERIERLAQKYLNLGRPRPNQLVALEGLKDSDFGSRATQGSTSVPAAASPSRDLNKAADNQPPANPVTHKRTPVLAGAVVIPPVVSGR